MRYESRPSSHLPTENQETTKERALRQKQKRREELTYTESDYQRWGENRNRVIAERQKEKTDAEHALKDKDNSTSKKFLMENEMAFDSHMLGFPSIQGCHAIVYQTDRGIYGFHNYGGSGDNDFSSRADLFNNFVSNHGSFGGEPVRLYGVSFIGNNQRGYSGNAKNKWKAELLEFAQKLNYKGKISGYDLHKSFSGENDSAYVEFQINEAKSDIYIRKWNSGESLGNRVANPSLNDHKKRTGPSNNMLVSDSPYVFTEISQVGLTKISKEKLR